MKKAISMLLCLVLIGNLLVGCGNNDNKKTETNTSEETTNEVGSVEIRIGFWPPDDRTDEIALFEGYKAKCKELYPYITVVPDHYDYDEDTFLPKALAGETPTAFIAWLTEPQKLIAGGYVADITANMQEYGYDQEISEGFLDIVSKDGKIYGLPQDGYGLGLYLSVPLFKEAGLVDAAGIPIYPKTYEEVAQTAKIIKDKTGKAGLYFPTSGNNGGWIFCQTAWNFGAVFEVKEGDKWKANINSPEVLAALQWVHDLKFKYDVLLPDAILGWDEWIQNYGTYNVGMVFAAANVVNFPIESFQMKKDDIAIVPIPAGPKGDQVSLTGGNTYMFAADATPEEIDACFKFLAICGVTPEVTEDIIATWEKTWSTRADVGDLVGPGSLKVWKNQERIDAEQVIIDKYTNCNMALFNDYYAFTEGNLRPEEPILSQELYAVLDNCVQGALEKEDADLQKILDEANRIFQTEQLDVMDEE